MSNIYSPSYSMPAEWAPHRATWIGWPHLDSDFPGKIEAVRWAFIEFIRLVSKHETVEILCANEKLKQDLSERLKRANITAGYNIHLQNYERTWLRDSAATLVLSEGKRQWIQWKFNAWAKYDNFGPDQEIPGFIGSVSKLDIVPALRPDDEQALVLEGGAFDVDGEGTVLVTEQCLLSEVQERNPGLGKAGYEKAFEKYLGTPKTIWLLGGCEGDDTNGHIDDIARFVTPGKVVVASAAKEDTEQYQMSQENIRRLKAARDAQGRVLDIIEMPYPDALYMDGARLPASYLNFYIANGLVLMPTFNSVKDRAALEILAEAFPDRNVVGLHCGDWILGLGSLHCSTQQEPA